MSLITKLFIVGFNGGLSLVSVTLERRSESLKKAIIKINKTD